MKCIQEARRYRKEEQIAKDFYPPPPPYYMKHLNCILFSVLFLYSCSKKDIPAMLSKPVEEVKKTTAILPEVSSSGYRIIPTKSEVTQIIHSILNSHGVPFVNITNEAKLEEDLSVEVMYFFQDVETSLSMEFPMMVEETLTTVGKVINYISDVYFKEYKKKHSVTGTVEVQYDLGALHFILPPTVAISYSCEIKYLEKGGLDYEIISISSIESSIGEGKSNEITSNNIETAKSNISTSDNVVYDYVIKYYPTGLSTALGTQVDWRGTMSIEVVAAFKCENYSQTYKIEDLRVSLERTQDFTIYNPESPTNGQNLSNIYSTKISHETFVLTSPACSTTGGGGGNNNPTITAQELQSRLFNLIDEYMVNIDRPLANISMNIRLIEDMQFTRISMFGPDFDLDFIDLIFLIKREFGRADSQMTDSIIESFTTIGSIYDFLTTQYNVI